MLKKLSSLASDHHNLGRYSLEKLHLFEQYQRSTSPLRVAAVLVLTPLPTFFTLVAMNLAPLNDPCAGPSQNAAFFVRSTISQALRTFFTLLPMKQALALSNHDYSFATIALIACCTSLAIEAVSIPLAFTWRFPVVHGEMITIPLFLGAICLFSFVFANRTMRRLWRRRKLQLYVPIVAVQLVLFYSFLGLSVAFAHLSLTPQTIMIVLFPLVKFLLKHLVWKYARKLHDISTDITICMLEISGALYQTVCIQFTNSNWLNVWMVVADLLQCVHEVRSYVRLDYLGDGRHTLKTALAIIESALGQVENQSRRSSFVSPDTNRPSNEDTSRSAVTIDAAGDFEFEFSPSSRSKSLSRSHSAPLSPPNPVQIHPDPVEQMHTARSVYIPRSNVRHVQLARGKYSRRLMELNRAASLRESAGRVADQDEIASEQSATTIATTRETRTRSIGEVLRRSTSSLPSAAAVAGVQSPSPGKCQILSTPTPACSLRLRLRRSQQRNRTAKIYAIADTTPTAAAPRVDAAPIENDESVSSMSTQISHTSRPPSPHRRSFARRKSSSALRIDGIRIAHRYQARLLEQTLQLLFASEVLLFAEYMEVVIPVLYALCLGNSWLSPNAKYNVVVMGMTTHSVLGEIFSSLGYALLEMVTLVAMCWFMKRQYGVSALYQLAFLLETYWMTLQGKLVGVFVVVFNAVTVHQGATIILSA